MIRETRGFTLIELMIALAVIGILAAIAVPAYIENAIRGRISEGLYLSMEARLHVAENVDDAADLASEATSWNARSSGAGASSKYVNSVQIDGATGEITLILNQANVGSIPVNASLVFTPYVRVSGGPPVQLGAAILANQWGIISWGCASTTNAVATAKGMPALNPGTLPAQYAPSECR